MWWCVAFLPLVPLWRWQIEERGLPDAPNRDLLLRRRSRIPGVAALVEVARAIGGAVLSLALLGFAVATIGIPWATAPLRSAERGLLGFIASHPDLVEILGRTVQEKLPAVIGVLFGFAGMAIETGVFLAGAAIPVLVLMRLDLSMRRVPVRAVLRPEARDGLEANLGAS